tara:strand:- start:67 stop:951 length:885 start_codon:yes stop_codon:yes gene_type:complete
MEKLINHLSLNNFCLIQPEISLQRPFILTSPHSGKKTTKQIEGKIKKTPNNYLPMEDMFVNDISLELDKSGCSILQSNISRIVIDLNREENELDPSFISDPPEHINFNITNKSRSGIGLVPTHNVKGEKIYKKNLLWEDVHYRISNYYLPWHKLLRDEINRLLKIFGHVFVIDLHSMPSSNYNLISQDVDFVIGNNFDNSSSKYARQILAKHIESSGYKILFNNPYSGGFITKNYSSPKKNVQCIQIEINKKLYMDEKEFIKNKNFEEFSKDLKVILECFFNDISYSQRKFAAE